MTRKFRLLDHLEDVHTLGRRFKGGSTEDTSELLAVLQCQGSIVALKTDMDVSNCSVRYLRLIGVSYGAVCEEV